MKGKVMFGAGMATGYVMWSRQGRAAFRRFREQAGAVWHSPAVQHQVHDAAETVKHRAPEVMDKVTAAAKKAGTAAGSMMPGSHESRARYSSRHHRGGDLISDPGRKDASGHDWIDEGATASTRATTAGATTAGATASTAPTTSTGATTSTAPTTNAEAMEDRNRTENAG
jgi:hypothetical protein